jgi:cyclophilin family peptidyl-prolyl cis-trans isomerase
VSKQSKRERQRLNREARRQAELAATKRRKQLRTGRNVAILAVPLVVLFIVLQLRSSGGSETKSFASIQTTKGEIVIELDRSEAPKTADNFVKLAKQGFFNNQVFHRVSSSVGIIQSGDPTGSGSGTPGYTIPDEFPKSGKFKIGDVAMANTGQPNSGGSQWFVITSAPGTQLPLKYSRFGKVVKGLAVAQSIEKLAPTSGDGPPTEEVRVLSVTISKSEQAPKPPTGPNAPATSGPPSS